MNIHKFYEKHTRDKKTLFRVCLKENNGLFNYGTYRNIFGNSRQR
jgi:hypothetical protein